MIKCNQLLSKILSKTFNAIPLYIKNLLLNKTQTMQIILKYRDSKNIMQIFLILDLCNLTTSCFLWQKYLFYTETLEFK